MHHSAQFLLVCSNSPFLVSGGGEQRTQHLFDSLCRLGHVDLVCFTSEPPPQQTIGDNYTIRFYGDVWQECISRKKFIFNKLRFWSPYAVFDKKPVCESVVRKLIEKEKYDFIVVRYLETVFLCGLLFQSNLVVDVDDDPSQKFRSYFLEKNLLFKLRILNLYQFVLYNLHKKAILKSILYSFYSNKEQIPDGSVSYLPNMPLNRDIDQNIYSQLPGNNVIVFVGKMAYEPNWRGIDRFINYVWPMVVKSVPNIKLKIAGKDTPPLLLEKWCRVMSVEVMGYVEDLPAFYNNCDLVIAPIYHGAGTNIKVLEAMAMNRTCVASEFATRGLTDFLSHRENIMIAKNNFEFAETIIELLKYKELNNKIRKNAMQTIEEQFNKDMFCQVIKDVFNSLQS